MSHMELAARQGYYVPLKQVINDSDSESEDIHYRTTTKTNSKHQQQQQQQQLNQLLETEINVPKLQNSAIKRKPPNTLNLLNKTPGATTITTQPNFIRQNFQQQQDTTHKKDYNNKKINNYNNNNNIKDNKKNKNMMMVSDITINNDNHVNHFNEDLSDFLSFNQETATFNTTTMPTTTIAPDDAPDHVAILGTDDTDSLNNHENKKKWQHEPMSLKRRCCFLASCALCLIMVILFLWVIPCNEYDNQCPANLDRIKTHNWFNNYTKIELLGGINIVNGVHIWEKHLIFLYRGDVFFTEDNNNNSNKNKNNNKKNKRHGIISLLGSSGAVAWYNDMTAQPLGIDCTLLNIENNANTPVCLLIDELGMLAALNAQTGNWYWRYQTRSSLLSTTSTASSYFSFDLPLVLPDLDGDGVYELLLVSSIVADNPNKRNYLRILSGRQGRPLGEGTRLHDCDALRQILLESAHIISYSCLRNRTEILHSKSLPELYALITNKSAVGVQQLPNRILRKMLEQQRHYNTNNNNSSKYNNNNNNNKINNSSKRRYEQLPLQRNVYTLSGRELLVENVGNCPDNCNVTVVLSERPTNYLNNNNNKGMTKVLRNFTQYGMYGMVPVKWHFNDKNTGKIKMSGFVMKFWKWNLQQNNTTTLTNTTTIFNKNNSKSNEQNKSYNTYKYKNNNAHNINNNNNGAKKATTTAKIYINNQHEKYNKYNVHNRTKLNKRHHDPSIISSTVIKNNTIMDIRKTTSTTTTLNKTVNNNISESNFFNNKNNNNDEFLYVDNNNYKMQMITETVILVLFIGTETRIENTSQSSIIQFCRNEYTNNDHKNNNNSTTTTTSSSLNFNNNKNNHQEQEERPIRIICQPELNNQDHSMAIADLDDDGSQELVTYMSTFVQTTENPQKNWRLVTYVRLLRLQSELPSFYYKNNNNKNTI